VERAKRGERRYSLDEKNAGLQKGNRHGYFEGRTAQAGGVRNDGNECAVLVSERPADYQGRTGQVAELRSAPANRRGAGIPARAVDIAKMAMPRLGARRVPVRVAARQSRQMAA
jgi:ribosomal protein L21E